jgi:AmmeMemoRadiSam system protein B/AmmeMemoRadiSam system protein A
MRSKGARRMENVIKTKAAHKLLLLTGVLIMFGLNSNPFAQESVRKPAVAGQFYAGNADQLKREIEKYCTGGPAGLSSRLLISHHAGYVFSGPVAGKAYATLDRSVKTVIIIGPSHHAWFEGLALPKESAFRTPLGNVPLDQDKIKRLLADPNVHVNSEAHGPEHSIEVQVPFLQVVLKNFSIVPVLTGKILPEKAAEIIFPLIDDKTAVVASTDLSHYKSQGEARRTDDKTIATVMSGNSAGFLDACGEMPVRIVMTIAKKMGLSPKLLDARTSYETCPSYGADDRVVGYASIIYVKNDPTAQPVQPKTVLKEQGLTEETKKFLLTLARKSLDAAVKGEKPPSPENIPSITKEDRGCFVTLTINNDLRGCIGYIEPIKPLYQAVIENAKNAALSDPRFPRVTAGELPRIKVEVSVLTKPAVLDYKNPQDLLDKLVPDVDGVILQKGMHQSTYLPQVWEHFSGDKIAFLQNLSRKAGMDADGWKTSNVKRYRAEHFSE